MLVSILGDSISTYDGYSCEDYPSFYTSNRCKELGLDNVSDTWWMKVITAQGWTYLRNSSYSGRKVVDCAFGDQIADEQASRLRTDVHVPDLILIYMGANDFALGIPDRWTPYRKNKILTFADAYREMILRLRSVYPYAKIICGTLMRTRIKDQTDWVFPNSLGGRPLERFNTEIMKEAEQQECFVADLESTGVRYETLDGAHPTAKGHAEIAEAWMSCLRNRLLEGQI